MMNAILEQKDQAKREEGQRILSNVSVQIINAKIRNKKEESS